MIHHKVTDRQTDDMRSQDRALHYSASFGKNDRSFYTDKPRMEYCILSASSLTIIRQKLKSRLFRRCNPNITEELFLFHKTCRLSYS